jgi:phosphoglycerate dehydrogenase-like enzyme
MQKVVEGPGRELRSVRDQLIAEFGDRVDRDTIVRVAREEVLLFDRAKVRDFVAIIAWRLARDRLADMRRLSDLHMEGASREQVETKEAHIPAMAPKAERLHRS